MSPSMAALSWGFPGSGQPSHIVVLTQLFPTKFTIPLSSLFLVYLFRHLDSFSLREFIANMTHAWISVRFI